MGIRERLRPLLLPLVLPALGGCRGDSGTTGPSSYVLYPPGDCVAMGTTGGAAEARVPLALDPRCGGEWVAAAPDGGLYLAYFAKQPGGCQTLSEEELEVVLLRLTTDGQTLWSKRPGRVWLRHRTESNFVAQLAVHPDGGVLLAAYSVDGFAGMPSANAGTLVAAFAPDGTERGTTETTDGVLAMTPSRNGTAWMISSAGGRVDSYNVRELDANAAVLQSHVVNTGAGTTRVALDSTGAVAALGRPGDQPLVLSRFDAEGRLLWQHPIAGDAEADLVALDASGNTHALVGFWQSISEGELTIQVGASRESNRDVAWFSYDQAGSRRWYRALDGARIDKALQIVPDAEGGVYVMLSHINNPPVLSFLSVDDTRFQVAREALTLMHVTEAGRARWGRCVDSGGLFPGWKDESVFLVRSEQIERLAP